MPGIHVLFIGPRDLSHDLGVPGDTSAPAFQDALKRVLSVAEEAGLAAGILAPDAETARRYANQGLRFIGIGSDATRSPSPADKPSTGSAAPMHSTERSADRGARTSTVSAHAAPPRLYPAPVVSTDGRSRVR